MRCDGYAQRICASVRCFPGLWVIRVHWCTVDPPQPCDSSPLVTPPPPPLSIWLSRLIQFVVIYIQVGQH